jgi:hypothetical protein
MQLSRTPLLSAAFLFLSGCDLLGEAIDEFEGLTNPLVAQVFLLGIATPEDAELAAAIEDSAMELDRAIQVFLADAASADDLENAPVSGAAVSVQVGPGGAVDLDEAVDGGYKATGADGLEYITGQDATVSVTLGESTAVMSLTLPIAVSATVPTEADANTALSVELGSDYDGALGVVIDLLSSEVTWDNRPLDIQSLYDFTHVEGSVNTLEIPATAFPGESLYAVGIAGIENADPETFDGVNTLLTSFMAGKVTFYPVSTIPVPAGGR